MSGKLRTHTGALIVRLTMPATEVAKAEVWLCTNAASFVAGSTLTADGGMTAQ